jgi:hypothetical protein
MEAAQNISQSNFVTQLDAFPLPEYFSLSCSLLTYLFSMPFSFITLKSLPKQKLTFKCNTKRTKHYQLIHMVNKKWTESAMLPTID